MPALLYGMEAWKKSPKAEIQHLEKIQGKTLKRIFNLPIATPHIGLIIETGVWSAEQRMNQSLLMLYHNIINCSKDRLVKQIIQDQKAQNQTEQLNVKLEEVVTMKKSEWKKAIKCKVQNKIKKEQ